MILAQLFLMVFEEFGGEDRRLLFIHVRGKFSTQVDRGTNVFPYILLDIYSGMIECLMDTVRDICKRILLLN